MARKRQARKCTAQCTDGRPCSGYAIIGGLVCAAHSGRAPQVKRKARERTAEARALAVFEAHAPDGAAPVNIAVALHGLVGEVERFRDFMLARVAALTADQWSHDHPDRAAILAEIALYERALDRSARLLSDVARLGIDAMLATAAVRVKQAEVDQMLAAFEATLDVMERARRRGAGGGQLRHGPQAAGPGCLMAEIDFSGEQEAAIRAALGFRDGDRELTADDIGRRSGDRGGRGRGVAGLAGR